MLIVQISDLHVQEPEAGKVVGVDSNECLAAAIREINTLSPSPDVVIITGDLTHRGRSAEYETLAHLLEALKVPFYLLPGNHDEPDILRQVYDWLPYIPRDEEFIQYVVEDYPLRIIALDTTVADHHHGTLCSLRLAWLEERLQEAPERSTLIIMHHPPIKVGINWVDGMGLLSGAAELARIVRRHPQVRGIQCGHIHRSIQANLGGTPVGVAPSTCYATILGLSPQDPPMLISEPPGMHLHLWDGTHIITHRAYFGRADETLNLIPLMQNWEMRQELVRQGKGIPKSIGSRY